MKHGGEALDRIPGESWKASWEKRYIVAKIFKRHLKNKAVCVVWHVQTPKLDKLGLELWLYHLSVLGHWAGDNTHPFKIWFLSPSIKWWWGSLIYRMRWKNSVKLNGRVCQSIHGRWYWYCPPWYPEELLSSILKHSCFDVIFFYLVKWLQLCLD